MAAEFDVAVIGGGSGGYVAAIRASQLGLRTALVEQDKVGGTCLHRGCIPTKALLQTAAFLDAARRASRLGVQVADVTLDYAAASATKAAIVDRLHRGVQGLLRKAKVTVVSGRARLAGPTEIRVATDGGERALGARAIILATGSRPRRLPGLEVDGRCVLTSDEALDLDRVPRSAIVVGAGAVGVEFASLWRSLGAEVTVVEVLDHLVPLEDHDIGAALQRSFEERGIRCLVGTRLQVDSLVRNEGGIAVVVTGPEGEERLQAEVLLIATGRAANVEDLGLDEVGVRVADGVVAVDAWQRTTAEGILAIGDMAGGFQLAHKAMHEGIVAAEVVAGREPHPVDPLVVPRTTYCTPQVASVGMTERQARQAGREVRCGVMPFRANARALIWGEAEGFCKVVADVATDDVLGVHFVGHEVTELVAGPALGALLEATPFELGRAIAPHPTLSEVVGEAALALSGEAIHI